MSRVRSKTVTARSVRGLYRRGNTFWFAHQKEGRRRWVSLETDDRQLALARLRDLRDALEREEPPPTLRRMHKRDGSYWIQFNVRLHTDDAAVAKSMADRIATAIEAANS